MVAVKFFTLAALATGALAATSRPFKLGVQFPGKTLFLTSSTTASPNEAEGVTCTINNGKIACGEQGYGLTYGDLHTFGGLSPVANAPNNKNFAINSDGSISWKAAMGGQVHFSTLGGSNTLIAEICSTYGHPDGALYTVGKPKAFFV